jgi:hypothetical protein
VRTPLDLYVARKPPSTRHFLSQRVRQAYDDFAVPLRMGAFLSIVPLVAEQIRRGRGNQVVAATLASIALAEAGRRRSGGAERFPVTGSLLAPAWIAERSVCAWLALAARLKGGVRYGEVRISHSASSMHRLRRRHSASSAPSTEPDDGRPLSARNRIAL